MVGTLTHYSGVWSAEDTGADYTIVWTRNMQPWQPFVMGVLIGVILAFRIYYWIF